MSDLSEKQLGFRKAMASLAAAVNIVTTDGPHGRLGITVSAVCSVTDSPPTILVCINRNSECHDVFSLNGRLALNVLSAEQEELARHFSGATGVPMPERFEWDIWDKLGGIPVLSAARSAIVGTIVRRIELGTHSVFFVEVEEITIREAAQALVYDRRAFYPVGARAA